MLPSRDKTGLVKHKANIITDTEKGTSAVPFTLAIHSGTIKKGQVV